VLEDGRLVGVKVWKERVLNREEWKTLLRTARNLLILHMPLECMNEILLLFSLFTRLDPKLSGLFTVFLTVVPQMCYVRVNRKISSQDT